MLDGEDSMRMWINNLKLKLLLEEKRDYIGNKNDGLDTLIAGIVFLLSQLCSTYHDVFGINAIVIQTVAVIFGIVITGYGGMKLVLSKTHKYDHKSLYSDIRNLDEVTHPFSIVAIKDTYNEYANKFLLYYDKAWKCWFFFSFHSQQENDEIHVKTKLSNMIHIPMQEISLEEKGTFLQAKHSVKDDVDKVYLHKLYAGAIKNFSDEIQKNRFEIDGISYRWMSVQEMEENARIMEINNDVVSIVKQNID
jgi:hypothetical protein